MRTRYNQFDSKVTKSRELHEGGGKSFHCTVYYRDCDPGATTAGDFDHQVAYWYGPWEDAPDEPADDSWTDLSVRLRDPTWPGTDKFDRACDKIAWMVTDGTIANARIQMNDHRETLDEHDLEEIDRLDPVELGDQAASFRARVRRSAGYGPDDEDEALAWNSAWYPRSAQETEIFLYEQGQGEYADMDDSDFYDMMAAGHMAGN